MEKIVSGIPRLIKTLGPNPAGFTRSILTTDTGPKSAGVSVSIGGKKVTVWGCTKGAGMYHPNMATMLGFIATDAAVSKSLLNSALKEAVDKTYNRSTIDGDTSTNDSVFILANGLAGNRAFTKGSADYKKFVTALTDVCGSLAEQIVAGGEGVKRIAQVTVEKAPSERAALTIAKTVAGSLLVKTALHGGDPNWGRILMAAGNSGVKFQLEKLDLYFGKICAMKKGISVPNAEKKLAVEMKSKRVEIRLVLNSGKGSASYLFSDLSREYVTINADYRT
jgi:glutamate N-acetyltransferase/amino-acid N-acetyltransferase